MILESFFFFSSFDSELDKSIREIIENKQIIIEEDSKNPYNTQINN